MKKAVIAIIVIGLVLIGGFFLIRSRSNKTTETTATVQKGTLTVPLTLSGEVKAKEQYTTRFQTAGLIQGVFVQEGDTVRKHQTLASLDQRKLKNDMQQLLNSYLDTRWNFEQVKSDNQTSADTAAQQAARERAQRLIDRSQFSLNNSVLDVEAQALALEFAALYSPIDGIVTKAPTITSGMNITVPTQAEFEITNPQSLYFEATADQTEITLLATGKAADIVLDSFPEATFTGTLQSISYAPVEGEVGTVYGIDVSLPDTEKTKLRLGMTGDVTFISNTKENALFVPIRFVNSKGGKKYVVIKENGKNTEKEVETGLENDSYIEITSGVSEGTILYD